MESFTCVICQVIFSDADLHRAHYKTDWHRYNLKRKVAELQPVTAENFRERVLAQREQEARNESVHQSLRCEICNKHFSSENAYKNHVQSKKHREMCSKEDSQQRADVRTMNEKNKQLTAAVIDTNIANSPEAGASSSRTTNIRAQRSLHDTNDGEKTSVNEEDAASEEESWEDDALGLEECLFCSHVSKSLDANISHMTRVHSFFIPDIEYLIDLEGLIAYLDEKVGQLHMCLWCGEKSRAFVTVRGVQQHMVDKGHCKLLHEAEALLEYADFYDYRSSYPDNDGSDEQQAVGGEDMETEDIDDEDEEEVSPEVLKDDGYVLVLPSGATIGHRSLMRYYKQKLKPDRQISLVTKNNSYRISQVMTQYKALGWTGTTGQSAVQKAKDINYIKRIQSRYTTKLGVRANKLQKHFRDQVFGR